MNSTFAPLLKQNGMPNHAIVDTGRNAVTGLRAECKCPTPLQDKCTGTIN